MPVDFLTADQRSTYGHFGHDLSAKELATRFMFEDKDRGLIGRRRSVRGRLGYGLQVLTVRHLGVFLADPLDVPWRLVEHVARQLDIADPTVVKTYGEGTIRFEHQADIAQAYGYADFNAQPGHFGFLRWLFQRAYMAGERPVALFDQSCLHLVDHRILLPGVTTLERLVAEVRERATIRLWRQLAASVDETTMTSLEALLVISQGHRTSRLDQLRRSSGKVTIPGLVTGLRRLEEIRALGVGRLDLGRLPPGRVEPLARYVLRAKAADLARMGVDRRRAHLVAFAATLDALATDDVIELFDGVMATMGSAVARQHHKRRWRSLGDLDNAALSLRDAWLELLDAASDPTAELHSVIALKAGQVTHAVDVIAELAQQPDERGLEELVGRYSPVRKFMPLLLSLVDFDGIDTARPVLDAVNFLRRHNTGRPSPGWTEAPDDVVTPPWRRFVDADGFDHRAYTLCVVERLRDSLRRRDVFVPASRRWGDPRAQLLQGSAWDKTRADVCSVLHHQPKPDIELAALTTELDTAWRRTAENVPANLALTIDEHPRRHRARLHPLDRVVEPASLITLRHRVASSLPLVELPELLLDVAAWTGFCDEFIHLSTGDSRVPDLAVSICAVLVAEACNVSLASVARPDVVALTRERLVYVAHNYLRPETLVPANACLVNYQTTIALARKWGGGDVASADGLRFMVPARAFHGGPNPHYFGQGSGITLYGFISNQYTQFHHIVIPGTMRDSIFILEGLLENRTELRPTTIATDTAGSSEVIFGLFWLLGYQFTPRLADLNEARFWRIDRNADYGTLNGLAANKINTKLIAEHWDDLLRVVGSLQIGTVKASDLVRSLHAGSRTSSLTAALVELGRIAKTLHLLAYIDSEEYRRAILIQLNRGEARHALARDVCHGRRGKVLHPYREGQEDQLGALGLVVNAIVLWNTAYLDRAIVAAQTAGIDVNDADIARLGPLGHEHLNLEGRFTFSTDLAHSGGERPLRDPEQPEAPDL